MLTVVVVVHLLIAMAMIGLILLQKTEGNASGGGFAASSNIGSMMQPRARANPMTNATVILGIAFFATSIGLALMSKHAAPTVPSILMEPAAVEGQAPKVTDIRPDEPTPPVTLPESGTPAPSVNGPAAAPGATPSAPPAVPNK